MSKLDFFLHATKQCVSNTLHSNEEEIMYIDRDVD